ncbi:MAG TPA: hypothetical protein VM204_07675 [Gaiellaceae bacterium]|nr:hypothetical protein [Gaiellaceae bacterium]
MARAAFTYELRKLPEEAFGIEDYVVRTSDGEPVGTVAGLLRLDGELLLAVDREAPPVKHDRRVVRWSDVDHADHEALAVWLRLDRDAFERTDELDPDGVRLGESADARRVTDLPPELEARPEVAPAGPVDETRSALVPVLGGAVAFALLAAVMVAALVESTWAYALLAVPAVLAVVAAWVAFRSWRRPYEPLARDKP